MRKLVPVLNIERHIYLIRGHKVMLDTDLALLYGVETRALNQAVKRNRERFPDDFMFQLTREEIMGISQIVTSFSKDERLKFSKSVSVFTEHGVSMLSSVLRSSRAIQVNIMIMRAFSKLRELLATHEELARKLEDLEMKYDSQFKVVFDAIRELMEKPVEKLPPLPKVKGFTSSQRI